MCAQSCPTLCNTMDYSPPGSSVHGIFQASILEWVAISSFRGSSRPRDQTCISGVSCIAGRFFTAEPQGKPRKFWYSPIILNSFLQFSSFQLLSHVRLFATPWITARQASLSITNFLSSLKAMSIQSVMPSNHLSPCCPLLLLPPIPLSIRVFSNESTLCMRWLKYWSFSFSISPS